MGQSHHAVHVGLFRRSLMPRLFVSYNRRSAVVAGSLVKDVESLGHDVWFDQELSGGQEWWDQILTSIRDCDGFVFLMDEQSLNSTACKREFAYAAELGKDIVPVLVADGVSLQLLPPEIARLQFIDYRIQIDFLQRLVVAGRLAEVYPHPPNYHDANRQRYFSTTWEPVIPEFAISLAASAFGIPYVAQAYADITVRVQTTNRNGDEHIATGVVIGRDRILTNAHVIIVRKVA